MHLLSNTINENIPIELYDLDFGQAIKLALAMDHVCPDIPVDKLQLECRERPRNPQTPQLLSKLQHTLIPCQHTKWLQRRGVTDITGIYSIGEGLSHQDLLDLYIYPNDLKF